MAELCVGRVSELWRHPVKSMAGETLEATELISTYGIPGDRGWAVRDDAAGEIRSAKKLPALLGLSARYVDTPSGASTPTVAIQSAGGLEIRSDDAEASARLSEWLDRPVTLCERRPADDRAHYRRAEPIVDMEASIREASELLPEEPTPLMAEIPVDFSVVAEHVSPPGTYFDFFALHLLTTHSLDRLRALLPDSRIEPPRFRPNLVIDSQSAEGLPDELEWCGRTLLVGNARLDVVMPMMRCAMVTHLQRDLPKDPGIMRGLVRELEMNFGVGVQVSLPGRVRVGDEVKLLDPS